MRSLRLARGASSAGQKATQSSNAVSTSFCVPVVLFPYCLLVLAIQMIPPPLNRDSRARNLESVRALHGASRDSSGMAIELARISHDQHESPQRQTLETIAF